MHIRQIIKINSLLLYLLIFPGGNLTQAAVVEAELKSAYIINILNYVEWPVDKNNQLKQLCIYSNNPFENYLEKFARLSNLKKQHSVKISYPKKLDELAACHVVFISSDAKQNLEKVIALAKIHSILTISDIKNFADNNGMIGFVSKNKRVKLHINYGSTKAAQLDMNYQLLELAEKVIKIKLVMKS